MSRNTRQRRAIEATIENAVGPVMPQEILRATITDVASINLSTIYRTLGRMVAEGDVVPVQLPGEPIRYERRDAAETHHHHFRCTNCDSVYDLEGCVAGLKGLLPQGFKMIRHDITLYGTCRTCAG